MIELLDQSKWHELLPIFEGEFRSAMPRPENASIVVCRENEKIKGFVTVESVVWLPELYVDPKHRGGSTAYRLLKYVEDRALGKTVLCTPDSRQVESMCEGFGLRKIQGSIYVR